MKVPAGGPAPRPRGPGLTLVPMPPIMAVRGSHLVERPAPEDRMANKGKSSVSKPLCKWKPGQYVKELELLTTIVSEPVYYCRDCGRVAAQKKWLCKPERLVSRD